ncbi:MAG: Maf family protein, partial [Gammaproteobacteria bacterium]
SGKKHKVHTAVAIVTANREFTALNSSEVEFAQLTDSQIDAYVETGEPMDKAGGYAIQGLAARFVINLNGSFSGVMGLPIYETANLLSACGVCSRI